MIKVMEGVRVLEVAQFTFVPAAGAILADWGADVIKVEHPVRGDTQRGFLYMGGIQLQADRHPLMEHPNRGKRSVGIDVSTPGGQEVLYEIAKTSDVFLTNYMPAQRQKNKFDIEHIRAANPNIIYARGSAYGDKGAERDTGGFDGTAFWTRSGVGHALTPEEIGGALSQGIPAFGDSIGGMNIAGGISAALFHRERTGEAVELDVSLLSTAWWSAGASMTQGMEVGETMRSLMPDSVGPTVNPFLGNYLTSDGGTINLCIVSPTGYIRDAFEPPRPTGAGRRSALQRRDAAHRECRGGSGTHRRIDSQQALRLLARAPQDDEGSVGAVPELPRPRDRRAGHRQRHDRRGRCRRRWRAVQGGPRPGSVQPRAAGDDQGPAGVRAHRDRADGTRAWSGTASRNSRTPAPSPRPHTSRETAFQHRKCE